MTAESHPAEAHHRRMAELLGRLIARQLIEQCDPSLATDLRAVAREYERSRALDDPAGAAARRGIIRWLEERERAPSGADHVPAGSEFAPPEVTVPQTDTQES